MWCQAIIYIPSTGNAVGKGSSLLAAFCMSTQKQHGYKGMLKEHSKYLHEVVLVLWPNADGVI